MIHPGAKPGCFFHVLTICMQIRKMYIDGYNALRKVRRYEKLMKSNADAARRGFAEHVRGKLRHGTQAVIVFDGAGEHIPGTGPVSVVYSYTRTADSWIRHALENEHHPAAVLVVSSDHEVQNHARACGAQVKRSEDFLDRGDETSGESAAEKPPDRALNDDEVAMWMRLFSGRKDG